MKVTMGFGGEHEKSGALEERNAFLFSCFYVKPPYYFITIQQGYEIFDISLYLTYLTVT